MPTACDTFEEHVFRKGTCRNCGCALAEHATDVGKKKDRGKKKSRPLSQLQANGCEACDNFEPNRFQPKKCINCFFPEALHGDMSKLEVSDDEDAGEVEETASDSDSDSDEGTPPAPPPPRASVSGVGATAASDTRRKKPAPPPPPRKLSAAAAERLTRSRQSSTTSSGADTLSVSPRVRGESVSSTASGFEPDEETVAESDYGSRFSSRPRQQMPRSPGGLSHTADQELLAKKLEKLDAAPKGPRKINATKREQGLREMLQTEKTYVRSLKTLLESFMKPLQKAVERGKPIIKEKYIYPIFSNLELILMVSEEVLEGLEAAMQADTPQVGPVFVGLAPYLKLYSAFVNNYENSMRVLHQCKKKKKAFVSFLDTAKKSVGMDIMSYLIMPVQRIPRYEMLLQLVRSNTPTDWADYGPLTDALKSIQTVAVKVNESKRAAENLGEMMRVQGMITHLKEALVVPGRSFHKQGSMRKKPLHGSGRDRDREFFLFSDILLYAKRIRGERFEYKGHVPLDTACVKDVAPGEASSAKRFEFQVLSMAGNCRILAPTKEVKQDWMNAIQDVVDVLQSNLLRKEEVMFNIKRGSFDTRDPL